MALADLTPPSVREQGSRWVSQIKEYVPSGSNFGGGEEWGCRGWDPEGPEELDPEGCLKARQYRQTMKVLSREMEAKQ